MPMKELISILEGLGAETVRTYIQSGNVVFRSPAANLRRFPEGITAEIHKRHRFEPSVLLLERKAFEKAISMNPFTDAEPEPKTLHLGFLASAPSSPDLKSLERLRAKNERFRLRGKILYLHTPDGLGRSKLAAGSERLLGVPMTARNWRTVMKIREMANEVECRS